MQIEQRFAPRYSMRCGGNLVLGTVETLTDSFLFRLFFPKLRILFSGIAGTVKAFLYQPVNLLELVYGLRSFHVLSLRRFDRLARSAQWGASP